MRDLAGLMDSAPCSVYCGKALQARSKRAEALLDTWKALGTFSMRRGGNAWDKATQKLGSTALCEMSVLGNFALGEFLIEGTC
jgi:hypothetical protein